MKFLENDQTIQEESIQFFINKKMITFDKSILDYALTIENIITISFELLNENIISEGSTKQKIIKKLPIYQRELLKEDRVEIIKNILNIENLDPNSKEYKKSKQWIITSGVYNFKFYNSIIEFLHFKIEQAETNIFQNKKQSDIRGKYIEILNLVENWITDAKNKIRFTDKKKRGGNDEDLILYKIQYNKNTGEIIIIQSKNYWKKLLESSKKYIRQFEAKYPELFTSEYFEKISSEFKNNITESINNINQKLFKIAQEFEEEDEGEMLQKIYFLLFIFLITDKPLSLIQIENFWRNIFSLKLSRSSKSIIKMLLKDISLFNHLDSKYSLHYQTKSSLRNDQDFMDFFEYICAYINEDLVSEELFNEEKLAQKSLSDESEIRKNVRNLPSVIQKPFGKLAEMVKKNFKKKSIGKNPKNKIMIQTKSGKMIDFDTFSNEENWQFYLEIKKSKIPNIKKGLFVTRDISDGEFIAPFFGDILSEKQIIQKYGEKASFFHIVRFEIQNKIVFIDSSNYSDSMTRYGKIIIIFVFFLFFLKSK